MFGDMFQAMFERRLVITHGRPWMICYVLGSTSEELKEHAGKTIPRFAVAAPCDENGTVELPCALQLIRFTSDQIVVKEQP